MGPTVCSLIAKKLSIWVNCWLAVEGFCATWNCQPFHSNKSSCPISQKDSLGLSALESWPQYRSNSVLIVRNGAVLPVKEDGEVLQLTCTKRVDRALLTPGK